MLAELSLIPDYPDYTTLWHRVYGLTPPLKLPKYSGFELASDRIGMKTSNVGEYRIFQYGDPRRGSGSIWWWSSTADSRRKKVIGIEVHVEWKGHSECRTGEAHLRAATEKGFRVRKFYGEGPTTRARWSRRSKGAGPSR